MSDSNVRAFLERINQDPTLQKRVSEIYEKAANTTARELSLLANELALSVTSGDILEHARESTSALSDEELSKVSGGLRLPKLILPAMQIQID